MTISKVPLFLWTALFSATLASAGYNPTDASEFASASALAYCTPQQVNSWTCGPSCQNLTDYQPYYSQEFTVTSNEGFAFSMIYSPSSERFITTFRGTVGAFELLKEIVDGGATAFTLENIPEALTDSFFFTNYMTELRPVVIEQLQKAYAAFPNYKFVFTGHSLGAALTTLAAYDAITSQFIPQGQVVVYNYGSPRVGNYELAQAIEATLPEIYRVVHWNDAVPHLPPCSPTLSEQCQAEASAESQVTMVAAWRAWHVSQEIFYNEAGNDYTICQGGEDPSCADQFGVLDTSVAMHKTYVNVAMNCNGASVVDESSDRETDDWTDSWISNFNEEASTDSNDDFWVAF